ncbi:tryptophan synthase subunit alpha [Streptomyces sp. NPDC058391]|uniref:tryptophan synthase subunit alpha n=1 Tax=Streptomyces sp. NPDC058391 TaxID=3346476 RepID=UPI00364F8EA1
MHQTASGWLHALVGAAPTGYRGPLDLAALSAAVRRLRSTGALPIVSGVGISTPRLAAAVTPLVDAVVIGTPVVRALDQDPDRARHRRHLRPLAPHRTALTGPPPPHRSSPSGLSISPIPQFHAISLGAGIRAMLARSAEGVLPKVDYAIFADTGWEPAAENTHLDGLEGEVATPAGIPVLRVTSGNIRNDSLAARLPVIRDTTTRLSKGQALIVTARGRAALAASGSGSRPAIPRGGVPGTSAAVTLRGAGR